MSHNVGMSIHIVGNIHPPKVDANSSQTVCIMGEKMKWQKETKGEMFLHYSERASVEKPCVMCHLTL